MLEPDNINCFNKAINLAKTVPSLVTRVLSEIYETERIAYYLVDTER